MFLIEKEKMLETFTIIFLLGFLLFELKELFYLFSIFSINLEDYEAYDKNKVLFKVDIMAFFKIDNSSIAAQRISSFTELKEQLRNIL